MTEHNITQFVITLGVSMKYARLFALLMRMRQTCCHPFLVLGNGSKKVVHPVATANNGPQPRNPEGLIHIVAECIARLVTILC